MAADISTPITQASAAVATTPGKKTGSYNAMDEALTQQDFLELLVTQIKNQDPTKPMDTNVMVSQMAQLSAVQGIADLNKTVATMKEAMRANQALAASMLVGRSVMASTDKANLGDTLEGAVDVPEGAKDVQVNILDDSGNVVKTLSLEGPDLRRDFFYQELKEWLYLSDEAGLDPVSTRGSYAGAMGMAQFMPGSWRKYGVDFDGDGKAYPFSTADALAAIAHFLQEHGFRFGEAIAEEARAVGEEPPKPEDFPIAPTLTKAALKEKGLVSASGAPLSADGALATGVILEGERPHYFLVYQNFYAITRYNRSFFYAMGVTELSRRLDCARGDG